MGCRLAPDSPVGDAPVSDDTAEAVRQRPSFVLPDHPRASLQVAELGSLLDDQNQQGVSQPIPPAHPRVSATASPAEDGLFHANFPLRGTPRATPTLISTRLSSSGEVVNTSADNSSQKSIEVSAVDSNSEPTTRATSRPTATTNVQPTKRPTALPTATPIETATSPKEVDPQRFVVIPNESLATYHIYAQYANLDSTPQLVTGKTQQVSGELVLFLGSPPKLHAGYIEVDLTTLNSRDPRRDLAIRTTWLESDRYPIARFDAMRIENGPSEWTEGKEVTFNLLGELTLRRVTQEVNFDVTAKVDEGRLTGMATTEIFIHDYDFAPPVVENLVEALDGVTLTIYLTAAMERS
ncbi:MAG: YceI family protein [Chloroflexota bacterium]